MITIANSQWLVHDQDEALGFYTRMLSWEVRADVTMEAWNFRWLCVGPPGQPGIGVVLMPVPGPPMLDEADSRKLGELVAKGAGGTLFLQTDDCEKSYDEPTSCGVRFNDPPTRQPYGIDTSFRDPREWQRCCQKPRSTGRAGLVGDHPRRGPSLPAQSGCSTVRLVLEGRHPFGDEVRGCR